MGRTHIIRLATTACGMALLAACSVGPDYVRPTAVEQMPATFKEMEGWKVAQPQDGIPAGRWWEIYRDPQLNALEEQVVGANQSVRAAEAQYRQARALVQAARAGYFPTLSAGASATRSRRSANLGTGASTGSAGGSGNTTSDFQLPLDAAWELDLWGRVRRSVEASQAGVEASAADLAAISLSVQTELAIDYFQLRALDAEKQVLDATVANYRKTLELTRNRYAAGVVAKVDILQAETQLKSAEAQTIDLGVQRSQLEHAIALLIGKAPAAFSLPPATLTTEVPVAATGLPSELLERRPDIASAERKMAAANAQIGVAKAAYYPTIRLSATAGLEATRLATWFTWPSRFWSVGPAIAQTLFDGGLRAAQTDQARAAYDATVATYRGTVLTAFQEVEDNLAALRILEEEAMAQDSAVTAARQAVTITTNQYQAGTVAYLNVLVAQTSALTNERAALAILGRRLAASVQLVKALGGGWHP